MGVHKTQTTTLWFIVEEKVKMITKVSLRAGTGAGEDAECFSHESLPCCLMCYCVCLVVGGGRDWTESLLHGKLCSTTVLCPQPALHFLKISRQVLIKSSNGP